MGVTANESQGDGGPSLVYDHQMCIDSVAQKIYVFGGRTLSASPSSNSYSGLYSYDIVTGTWTLLRFVVAVVKARLVHMS